MYKKLLFLLISVNILALGVVKADDLASIQEQLSWMKYSALEEAFTKLSKVKGYDVATNKVRMAELKEILSADVTKLDLTSAADLATAKKALDLQKQVLFDNPAFEFDKIILERYKLKDARKDNSRMMGTQATNWSNQTSAPRKGFDGEIGVLSNLKGDLQYEQVYKPGWDTSMPDLRLNWDGNRAIFSMTPEGDNHWQVYELDVNAKEVTQLTHGSKEYLDFFDAAYLPSGKLVMMSNTGSHGVPCVNGNDQVGNMYLFDPATEDLRRLTFDQDANWGPVMMHNGKVMYTRWEYTDLMHYYSRFVMFMNPDGTEQKALFGSGMTFPNSTFDIQPLPDHPSRFVGIVSGHHGVVRAGRLFMYDPAVSRNTTDGMIHEFPYKGRKTETLVKDRLVDGVWPQFIKPFPIDNDNILVSAKMSPDGLWGLYVVDVYDNLTLVAEFEGEGLIGATPLRKTTAPPVIPDKVDLTNNEATVFIQDIYEGEGLPGVPRGTVKKLRIHTYEYVYNKTYSNHYGLGIQSGWDMKTNLGTVDVEEDGSAIFKIPANTPVSIQPLDSEGRAIQWMRSWFVGMPGETVSCVGCHEDQNQIPMPKKVIASTRSAHALEAPKGGVRPFTFDLEVQPVLDRNCISCHGEGKKLDFTGGKKDKELYGSSFLALHPYVHRQGAEAALKVMVPYEYHASVSPLVQLLKNGHYGVELTDDEWYSIYNWIDYNAPDIGYHRVDNASFPYDQYEFRIEMGKKYANGIYADWRKQLEDYEAYLKAKGEIEPVKPSYEAPKFKNVKVKGYPAKYTAGETMDVEVAPGVSITFVKVPAGAF
ncbi:MAG: formylglycine-generating enzyme family protein, partial [Rikenellaceae bacterium]